MVKGKRAEPVKRTAGRPRKQINRKMLKQLAQAQLSNGEMAQILGCSPDTLERNFAAVIKAGREHGVGCVRRRLFQTATNARKPNVAAQIFFLKNYGGMKDAQEHSGPNGGPIPLQIGTPEENERRIAELLAKSGASLESVSTQPGGAGRAHPETGSTAEVPGSE
jgi:hypothetical protein